MTKTEPTSTHCSTSTTIHNETPTIKTKRKLEARSISIINRRIAVLGFVLSLIFFALILYYDYHRPAYIERLLNYMYPVVDDHEAKLLVKDIVISDSVCKDVSFLKNVGGCAMSRCLILELGLILPLVYSLLPLTNSLYISDSSTKHTFEDDDSFSSLLNRIAWSFWFVSLALMACGITIGHEMFGCMALAGLLAIFAQGVASVSQLARNAARRTYEKEYSKERVNGVIVGDDTDEDDDIKRELQQHTLSASAVFIPADLWSGRNRLFSDSFIMQEGIKRGRKRDFLTFIFLNYLFLQVGQFLLVVLKKMWNCIDCRRLSAVPNEVVTLFSFFTTLGVSLFTHGVGGRMFNDSWSFYHPFRGGSIHVKLQAAGWSLLGASLLLIGLQSINEKFFFIGSLLSWISEGLILVSILYYQGKENLKKVADVQIAEYTSKSQQNMFWLIFSLFQDLFITNFHWIYPFHLSMVMSGIRILSSNPTAHFMNITFFESIASGCILLIIWSLPSLLIPFSSRRKYLPLNPFWHLSNFIEWLYLHPNGLYFDSKIKFIDNNLNEYKKENTMFAFMPHGTLPFNVLAVFYHFHDIFDEVCLFFGSQITIVPGYRFYAGMRGGCMPIEKKRMINVMKTSQNVALMPGGVREMMYCEPRSKTINISIKHKGFVRLAIQQGYDLVPVFLFHSNDHYDNPFRDFQQWTYDKIGVPVGIPWYVNKWRLPMSNRDQLRVGIGKRLKVKQDDNPDNETVNELHRLFYEEVAQVFNKFKDEFGYGNRELCYVL